MKVGELTELLKCLDPELRIESVGLELHKYVIVPRFHKFVPDLVNAHGICARCSKLENTYAHRQGERLKED